jgi:hypothetical protein
MSRCHKSYLFIILGLFLFLFNRSACAEISAHTKLSYLFLDQKGSKHSLPELYNTYSGFSLEKLNFNGRFKSNSNFQVNLHNVNLDNRNLRFNLNLPDILRLRIRHNKSRFFFDQDGDRRSFRNRTDFDAIFKPVKFLKLDLNYVYQSKQGERLGYVKENPGVLGEKYDQKLHNGKAGVQLKWRRNYIGFSHRIFLFNSSLNDSLDRNGTQTQIHMNTVLPANFFLSFRYMWDESKLDGEDMNLKEDFLSGTLFRHFFGKILVSLRYSFQQTEDSLESRKTDIRRIGSSINYRISQKFETDLSYEYQDREDKTGEINTHSFLVGAKVRPIANLLIHGRYRFKTREDPDTSTLTGEYDQESILLKVKYQPIDKVNLQLRYQDKIRKNTNIKTKSDCGSIFSNIIFDFDENPNVTFYFNSLNCSFHNFRGNYRTSRRTYGLTIDLKIIGSLKLKGGATYLDIGRDLNIDKYSYSINVNYEFIEGYAVEAGFERLGYEDGIESKDYFDANVFKISISKSIN